MPHTRPFMALQTAVCVTLILLLQVLHTSGDGCTNNLCTMRQVCVPGGATHRCYCPPGYTGSTCQIDCLAMQADIMFVVESPDTFGVSDWHVSLDIVTSFISRLDSKQRLTVAPSRLHFGMLAYSSAAHVTIPLGYYVKNELISRVESATHTNQGNVSDTSAAFWILETTVFGVARQGDRPGVPNVAIFVVHPATPSSVSAEVLMMLRSDVTFLDDTILMYAAIPSVTDGSVEYLTTLTGGATRRVLWADDIWSKNDVMDNLLTEICRPKAHTSQPGFPGEVGSQGLRGLPGSEGMLGRVGPRGRNGHAGSHGSAGPDGAPGPEGPLGHPGPRGDPGDVGKRGHGGDVGHIGTSGERGFPGLPGHNPLGTSGVGGVQGGVGWPGEEGPQGLPGHLGAGGERGGVGLRGPPGTVGAVGPAGPRGPAGAKGSVGPRGPPGQLGPRGNHGPRDIARDGCMAYNHTCQHACVSVVGGFKCQCYHGYRLRNDSMTCEDADDCAVYNGGCDHFCHDHVGSHVCSCEQGFTLSRDLKSCLDVNECCMQSSGPSPCMNGTQQKCVNTYGGYMCLRVPYGYQIDAETGFLLAVSSLHGGAWDLVCREVVVALLGWVACLTVLVFLTLLLTWLSDDLLLYMLSETSNRRKNMERTPREFFLFPKIEAMSSMALSGSGSKERLEGVGAGAGPSRLGSRYIDARGYLTPSNTRDGEAGLTSTPGDDGETGGPSPAISICTLPEVCRATLAMCPSIGPSIEALPPPGQ